MGDLQNHFTLTCCPFWAWWVPARAVESLSQTLRDGSGLFWASKLLIPQKWLLMIAPKLELKLKRGTNLVKTWLEQNVFFPGVFACFLARGANAIPTACRDVRDTKSLLGDAAGKIDWTLKTVGSCNIGSNILGTLELTKQIHMGIIVYACSQLFDHPPNPPFYSLTLQGHYLFSCTHQGNSTAGQATKAMKLAWSQVQFWRGVMRFPSASLRPILFNLTFS